MQLRKLDRQYFRVEANMGSGRTLLVNADEAPALARITMGLSKLAYDTF
jgi:hypothetical protein